MISFSSIYKRRGATLAGIFSVALSSVVLLCGAGSVPVENFLPQGAMQGDLNAGGHNLTNAATVSATNVVVSGTFTAPSSFALSFSQVSGTPTTLAGYGITDPIVLTSGSYSNPSWVTALAASKLTGALPKISGNALTGIAYGNLTGTPMLGSLAALSPSGTADGSHYLRGDDTWAVLGSGMATALGNAVNGSGGVLTYAGLGTVAQAHSANLDTVATGAASNPGYVLTANGDGTVAYKVASGGSSLTLGTNFSTLAGISSGTLELSSAPNTASGVVTLDAYGNLNYEDGSPLADSASTLHYPDLGGPLADGGGLYYIGISSLLSDSSGELYFSDGEQLADSAGNLYGDGANLTGLLWSQIGNTPTTLAGYGITDAGSHVSAPSHSTSTGVAGQWAVDSTYFYICTGTNAWGRITLTTSF